MDKYEYQVCADQIKLLVSERRYADAMNIADTIDWRKVRSVSMLCTVSEVYKINKKYEEARDILLLAYDRYPNGRTIVYALCELALKLNDILQAKELYEEYCRLAPEDTNRYILLYKLYETLDVSLEERIEVLEEFKNRDYREKWAYELALLYHKTGQETRCVEECDELILWFGDGKYVNKAMELKMKHAKLSKEQQYKYEGRREPIPERFMKVTPVQQIYDTDPQAGSTQQIPMPHTGQFDPNYLNAAERMYIQHMYPEQAAQLFGQQQENNRQQMHGQDMQMTVEPVSAAAQRTTQKTAQMLNTSEIDSIQVQPVNVGMYNTMDLQNGLSEKIKEFFEKERRRAFEENAEKEAEQNEQLYDTDTVDFMSEFTTDLTAELETDHLEGSEPVIRAGSPDPAENEMDDDPEEKEDVQITTFIPINAELIANGEAGSDEDEEEYSGYGEDTADYEDEEGYPEPEEDAGEYEDEEGYPASEEDAPDYEQDEETDRYGDEEDDEDSYVEENAEGEYEYTGGNEEENNPDKYTDEGISESGEEEMIEGLEDEIAAEIEKDDPVFDDVYKDWKAKKKELEIDRIQEAKKRSLVQTNDIMSKLKGVLPEIDDIAKPTPPRVVTKKDTGELPDIKPAFKPHFSTSVESKVQPVKISLPLPLRKNLPTQKNTVEDDPFAEDTFDNTEFEDEFDLDADTEKGFFDEEEYIDDFDYVEEISPKNDALKKPLKKPVKKAVKEPVKKAVKEPVKKTVRRAPEKFPVKEVSFDPNEEMGADVKTGGDLYFREIMKIEDPEEEQFGGEKAGIANNKQSDELTYSEDEEAARKAAFEVTSELPKYPYEGLEDYGEVEEIEVLEQPEGLDGIMKTSDIPLEAIARANYEAGLEAQKDEEEEESSKKKAAKKQPSYMKIEKTAVSKRDFDKEEKLVFGRFDGIQWLKAQIVNTIDSVSMEPSKGNVIVTGSESSGRRTIAIDIVKVMQHLETGFIGKVAKISGEALNKKDIPLTIKKLKRGALIIENASGLTPSSARIVAETLELETDPVLVVMEGEKEKIDSLLSSSKEIMDRVFNARIDLQDYTTDDLVAYGRSYAKELEYSIDEMGVLALYRRIGDMQTLEHTVTFEEVREIIDNAIKHVDKKNMSHFMDVLLAKRYDDEDFIILREKDFII